VAQAIFDSSRFCLEFKFHLSYIRLDRTKSCEGMFSGSGRVIAMPDGSAREQLKVASNR